MNTRKDPRARTAAKNKTPRNRNSLPPREEKTTRVKMAIIRPRRSRAKPNRTMPVKNENQRLVMKAAGFLAGHRQAA